MEPKEFHESPLTQLIEVEQEGIGSASGDNYCGYYFTTSVAPSADDCITLYYVNGDEKGTLNHSEGRYCGFPIRPVWKD